MSAVNEFLKNCINIPVGENLIFFVYKSKEEFRSISIINEEKNIKNFLKNNQSINTIAVGINTCKEFCKRKEIIDAFNSDNSITLFVEKLNNIADIIASVIQEEEEQSQKERQENDERIGMKEDVANIPVVLDSYDKKIQEIHKELDSTSKRLQQQSEVFDSKVFQLLINTIAVLGVFVAIAFTGWSGISILSSVPINFSDDLSLGAFTLCLQGLIIYNILFVLVYFVSKILDKFWKNTENKSKISFKPLYFIDGIMLVAVIVLYIITKLSLKII